MNTPTPADPADVPEARAVTASPWAAYATGEWFRLDTMGDDVFTGSRSRDVTAAGRAYARRNGRRWECRPDLTTMVRGLPRYLYVRMVTK